MAFRQSAAERESINQKRDQEAWIASILEQTGLDEAEFHEARRLFDERDESGDGCLDCAEIDLLFRQMKKWMSVRQLWALIQEVDEDMSGSIEIDEFCMMLAKLKGKRPLSREYYIRQISRKERIQFEGVFKLLDSDNDKQLQKSEVEQGLKRLRIQVKDAEDFERVFREIDLDGSGCVELEEFLIMMSKLRKPRPQVDAAIFSLSDAEQQKFGHIFRTFDTDGQGSMGLNELHQLFVQVGFNFPIEQTRALLQEVDADNSGEIELGEFFFLLVKLGLGSAVRLRNILGPGCTYEEAFRLHVPLEEMWDLGYDDLMKLREAGWSAQSLSKAGFGELLDFRRAGFSAEALRASGWSAQDLKLAGFSLAELRVAGFSSSVLRRCCRDLENQRVDLNRMPGGQMAQTMEDANSPLPLKPRTPPLASAKQEASDPALRWWATPRIKNLIDEYL